MLYSLTGVKAIMIRMIIIIKLNLHNYIGCNGEKTLIWPTFSFILCIFSLSFFSYLARIIHHHYVINITKGLIIQNYLGGRQCEQIYIHGLLFCSWMLPFYYQVPWKQFSRNSALDGKDEKLTQKIIKLLKFNDICPVCLCVYTCAHYFNDAKGHNRAIVLP